tara:strand:- start:120 stop:458 length:339 start_codon:yes stop_codon:yes gene_type:complete
MIKKEAGRKGWSTLSPKEGEVAPISDIEFKGTSSGPVNGAIGVGDGEGKICRLIEIFTPYGELTSVRNRGISLQDKGKEAGKCENKSKKPHDWIKIMLPAHEWQEAKWEALG